MVVTGERLSCADRRGGVWRGNGTASSSHGQHRRQGSPGGWHQRLVRLWLVVVVLMMEVLAVCYRNATVLIDVPDVPIVVAHDCLKVAGNLPNLL